MFQSWSILIALWPSMLAGTALVLAGTWIGWVIGRHSSFLPVRWIAWWITRVILPLLRTRSWLSRAATIFVNNGSIAAGLVALGVWPHIALVAILILGTNLGIALRVLSNSNDAFCVPGPDADAPTRLRVRLGVAMNLLEPPAIAIALGLAIGQRETLALGGQVWLVFGGWVLPLLFIAAAGEAMWLGAYSERDNGWNTV